MNKVTLIGRIGKDPETRQFEGGQSVTKLSIATSERYTNKAGEKVEETEWHTVKAWGKLGEILAKYFQKGDPICITGNIQYRSYEKDGQKIYYTEITAKEFEFLPKVSGEGQAKSDTPKLVKPGNDPDPANVIEDDDDLPF